MSDFLGELIGFGVVAVVVVMLAFLTAKLEKKDN